MSVMGPKRGDLEPPLVVDVWDGRTPATANLNDVVSWRMIGRLRSAPSDLLFDDTTPAYLVDPTDATRATITHQWQTGETGTAGVVEIEVVAYWPGGRSQTFPNSGYATVTIDDDLG